MIFSALISCAALVVSFAAGWVARGSRRSLGIDEAFADALRQIDRRVQKLEGGKHG